MATFFNPELLKKRKEKIIKIIHHQNTRPAPF
jgi:hypothetical protein